MNLVVPTLLILVGIINIYPAIGMLSAERVQSLYALGDLDANLTILMRHRAVLFGLIGGVLIASAFLPAWRPMAMIAGFVSRASFIVIAYAVGDFNPAIKRVIIADVIGLVLLAGALALHLIRPD